ncbi:hypothetical protein Drorol1_Dr00021865 [Drosera rotundifolia]
MESTADAPNPNPKHQAMLDRFAARHPTTSTPSLSTSTTTATRFLSQFSGLKSTIADAISSSTTRSDLAAASSSISSLDSLLAHHSYLLSSFDLKSSLHSISDLRDSLETKTNQLFPKKKFSFRNKKSDKESKEKAIEAKEKVIEAEKEPIEDEKKVIEAEKEAIEESRARLGGIEGLGFRGREGEVLEEEFVGDGVGEFTMSDLVSCEVRLKGRSRAIFVHRLRECRVYVGPVTGSVLIEDVKDCVFALASHQIRIHGVERCDFYLRVRSRPIVEDCKGVRFAPYCLEYDGVEEDLSVSRLDEETGNWGNVDDFKWLRAVQSPNWCVLPEDERIKSIRI